MLQKISNRKGTSLIIWILVIAVIVMALIIIVPMVFDVDGGRAKAEDEGHEQTCRDSARLEGIFGRQFDAVYDYKGKKFVGLNEHPYKVEPYGSMKEHEDCVILVHCDAGATDIQLSWISRTTLRERYR